jgi:quercetin dioxygenase-like cupin family protein
LLPDIDLDADRYLLESHGRLTAAPHPCTSSRQLWRGEIMDIKSLGSVPSRRMPGDRFTGTVWQDPIIEAPAPARIRAGRVSFEPGARTAWHTHPLGQTLHVVAGLGRVQTWGGPIREIRAGDTVWIPPGEKHWHGASPACAMTHIAMQEALDGTHVTWMEHVTDAQYGAAVSS